jgi:hypothetical protein
VPPPTVEEIASLGIDQRARRALDPLPTSGTSVYWAAQTHDFDEQTIIRVHVVRADASTGNVALGVMGDIRVGWSRAGPGVADLAAGRDTLWLTWGEIVDGEGDDPENRDQLVVAVDDETLEVIRLFRVPPSSGEEEGGAEPRVEVSGDNVWVLGGNRLWVTSVAATGVLIEVPLPAMPLDRLDLWAAPGGGIVIGSDEAGYRMLDTNGEVQWSRAEHAFAISSTQAYTMTPDGRLIVLDALTGDVVREVETGLDDGHEMRCCFGDSIHVIAVEGNDVSESVFTYQLVDPATGVVKPMDWVVPFEGANRWATGVDGIVYFSVGVRYDPETETLTPNPFGQDADVHTSHGAVRPPG